ncbi:MAG: hypothetical protein QOD92_447 [Acidimicrobiaceae bacterium]|jgi:hypothetical protein
MREKPTEHTKGRDVDPHWNPAYIGESFYGLGEKRSTNFEENDEEEEEA